MVVATVFLVCCILDYKAKQYRLIVAVTKTKNRPKTKVKKGKDKKHYSSATYHTHLPDSFISSLPTLRKNMKFASPCLLSIVAAAFALIITSMGTTVSAAALKGTVASTTNNQEPNPEDDANQMETRRQLLFSTTKKFDFVNQPYGLRFGGDIANLELPIVGLGRLILQSGGAACSFNGFGNLNSTFIPVSSEDVGGSCGYSFDATLGQGTFDVVLPSLGPLATSNYVFIMVEGGKKIFFIEKKNGIFVMIAEKQLK
jgi:hypothetical protein